jgi:hypothetical protein
MSNAPNTGGAAKPAELLVATDESGNVVATFSGGVTGPAEGVAASAGMVARHGARVHAVEMTPDLQKLSGDELHAALRDKVASMREDQPLPDLPDLGLNVGLKGDDAKPDLPA